MSVRVADYLPGVVTGEPVTPPIRLQPPVAVSLDSLLLPAQDGDDELLRHRFLCRGGGLLLVGPTGIGKSSLSMQAMLSWALGRHLFGIEPVRPLKSLLIQAENDDGDLAEMRDGVVKGLGLTKEEEAQAYTKILVARDSSRSGEEFFANTVRPLLEQHHPDLIWIDPALAFLEGEANSQEAVGDFLRRQLNPLLTEFGCAAVVIHHTNKPPKRGESSGALFGEGAYLGAGSAEWANWSRAVLALRPTTFTGVFELHAGKRGGRLRWVAEDGETRVFSKYIAHAKGDGEIYWRPATEQEIESTQFKGKQIGTSEEGKVLTMIPTMESIAKATLIKRCAVENIGRDKAYKLIDRLIEKGQIQEISVPRANKRPEVHIARSSGSDRSLTSDSTSRQPTSQPPSPPSSVAVPEPDVPDIPDHPDWARNIRKIAGDTGETPIESTAPDPSRLKPDVGSKYQPKAPSVEVKEARTGQGLTFSSFPLASGQPVDPQEGSLAA